MLKNQVKQLLSAYLSELQAKSGQDFVQKLFEFNTLTAFEELVVTLTGRVKSDVILFVHEQKEGLAAQRDSAQAIAQLIAALDEWV